MSKEVTIKFYHQWLEKRGRHTAEKMKFFIDPFFSTLEI